MPRNEDDGALVTDDHVEAIMAEPPDQSAWENTLLDVVGPLEPGGAGAPNRPSRARGPAPLLTRVSAGFILPALPADLALEGIPARGAVDLHDVITRALAAIDRVHTDGVLPKISVEGSYNSSLPSAGGFVSRSGVPVSIDINSYKDFAPSAMLTFIHETGHFLDLSALGKAGVFATLAGDVMLEGWRTAVDATHAVQTLRQRKGAGAVVIHTAQGPVEETVGDRHVEYLLGYDELWARSYAQYIAECSMDATLMAALDLTRPPAAIGQLYPAQWSTADFAPVAVAIDTLFRGLGWVP